MRLSWVLRPGVGGRGCAAGPGGGDPAAAAVAGRPASVDDAQGADQAVPERRQLCRLPRPDPPLPDGNQR